MGLALDETPDLELPDPRSVPVELPLLIEEARVGCMTAMLMCLDRRQRMAFILGEYFGATSESQSKKERAIFAKEDNCFIATSSIPQTLYEHDAGRKTQGPPRA